VLDLDADALDPVQDLSVQVGVVVSDLGLEDGAGRCERALVVVFPRRMTASAWVSSQLSKTVARLATLSVA